MSVAGQPDACPRCRATLDPGQAYCLECGVRVVVPSGRRSAARWMGPSIVALAVAGGGGAIAVAGSNDTPRRASHVIVALSRLDPAPPPSPAPPSSPRGHTPIQKLITWPSTSGYTLILSTVPLSAGPQQAKRKALAAVKRKLPDVGVLVSTSYASLHPGYYVVFSGIYGSREEAQAELLAARRYFPTAYASPVVR